MFTGGSLLYGSTGRPDLLGPDHTDALVHAQYGSAQRLARELPEDAEIYPTHGFGSFCSATQAQGTASTIGSEKRANPALTLDERDYVESLLSGLDAYPPTTRTWAPPTRPVRRDRCRAGHRGAHQHVRDGDAAGPPPVQSRTGLRYRRRRPAAAGRAARMMLALVLAAAVAVGVSLGLLGGGGSILTVPVLVYLAGAEPRPAIAMSLFVVGVTSAVGVVPTHGRDGCAGGPRCRSARPASRAPTSADGSSATSPARSC